MPPAPLIPTAAKTFGEDQGVAARLNTAFCFERGVVPLEWSEEHVTVGMADPTDTGTIAALRFATGAEIIPVKMSVEEVRNRLADYGRQPDGTRTGALSPAVLDRGRSLTGLFGDWVGSHDAGLTAIDPLRELLAAGYSPTEAGSVILAAHTAGERFEDTLPTLAAHLRGGGIIRSTAQTGPDLFPTWLRDALAMLPLGADEVAMFVDLLACEKEFARRRNDAIRLSVEVIVLAGAATVLWWPIAPLTALVGAGVALTAVYQVVWRSRDGPSNEFVRADVLLLIGVMGRHRVPPAAAIRCGLERLQTQAPTWGRVPDSREELARALRLGPLGVATLMRNDLEIAAECAARACGSRGERKLERLQWTVRLAAVVLAAAAISLLVA